MYTEYSRREFLWRFGLTPMAWLCCQINLLGSEAGTWRAEQQNNSADEIIKSVLAKYSTCKSYSDTGRTTTVFYDLIETFAFRTFFSRPSLFRFDWQDNGSAREKPEDFSTVRSDGEQTYLERPRTGRYPETLSLGMATATGCSAAAAVVPSLLSQDLGFRGGIELSRSELIESETVDGVDCHVLSGWWSNSEVKLYISSKDSQIVRWISGESLNIEEARKNKQDYTEYSYSNVRFDVAIPSDTFKFPHRFNHNDQA